MRILSAIALTLYTAIACGAQGDHVAQHQADIEALQSFGAQVRVTAIDPAQVPSRRIAEVVIPETWHGGDDGVAHIERIFADAPEPLPVVIVVGAPKISDARLKKLRETIPRKSFKRQMTVVFGISTVLVKDKNGVRVLQVTPDSPAAIAGIHADDLIIKIDKTEITDFDSFVEWMAASKPEQAVLVSLIRDGQTVEILVTLKEIARQAN